MSGGSYDYAYLKLEEFAESMRRRDSALRTAFAAHLRKVSKAMHDVEWVDSNDYGPGDEMGAIRDVLGLSDKEFERLEMFDVSVRNATKAIDEAFGPKEVQHGQS